MILRLDAGLFTSRMSTNLRFVAILSMSRRADTPLVSIWINPSVVALDEGPVLLRCEAESGNPRQLSRVRWFRDGHAVNETKESDVLLEKLQRTTTGNYTCQAKNDAGWSPMSSPKELVIMCESFVFN